MSTRLGNNLWQMCPAFLIFGQLKNWIFMHNLLKACLSFFDAYKYSVCHVQTTESQVKFCPNKKESNTESEDKE